MISCVRLSKVDSSFSPIGASKGFSVHFFSLLSLDCTSNTLLGLILAVITRKGAAFGSNGKINACLFAFFLHNPESDDSFVKGTKAFEGEEIFTSSSKSLILLIFSSINDSGFFILYFILSLFSLMSEDNSNFTISSEKASPSASSTYQSCPIMSTVKCTFTFTSDKSGKSKIGDWAPSLERTMYMRSNKTNVMNLHLIFLLQFLSLHFDLGLNMMIAR
mmetsp:Transcript_15285/g.19120  ORF Transcript_15285/g.19120 Transcript_15285/m.19120 type:complete len:219 (-) Transcript_15285:37-693(-)